MEGDNLLHPLCHNLFISIHTLRMEGDVIKHELAVEILDFNPHPPRGG